MSTPAYFSFEKSTLVSKQWHTSNHGLKAMKTSIFKGNSVVKAPSVLCFNLEGVLHLGL